MVRRVSALTIVVLLLAVSGSPAQALRGGAAARASGRTISGQVLYGFHACTSAAVSSQAPVAYAELLLRPARGREVTARLDARGRFRVNVPEALPVEAWLVLSDSRLEVAPLDRSAGAYRIPLGAIAFHQHKALVLRRRFVLVGPKYDGAANIWSVLHQGALVAADVSPVPVPAVTARWTYGEDLAVGTTHYDPADRTISVGAVPGTAALGEWEAYALLHEYAHHLLHVVADPGSPGGEHSFISVHPTEPALPWDEGFADAFPAIVQNDPVVKVDCVWKGDMSSAPAHPLPSVQSEAQYNEFAIAGTLWHLAGYLGSGSNTQGLRLVLRALHAHPAHSMRDFRDALAEDSQVESNADQQEQIDQIFRDQSISWGFTIFDGIEGFNGFGPPSTDFDYYEVGGKVDGPAPYDPCLQTNDVGPSALASPFTYGTLSNGAQSVYPIAGPGGLPHAWQSDCLSRSDGLIEDPQGPGNDFGMTEAGFSALAYAIPFPYAPADPQGTFTVSVRADCWAPPMEPACTGPFLERLYISNGVLDPPAGNTYGVANAQLVVDVSVPRAQWVPVATFDQMGHCHVLTGQVVTPGPNKDPLDCSD